MAPGSATKPINGRPTAERLRQLQALLLDCDGVLTSGELLYDDTGRRLLRFNARDGVGLAMLAHSSFPVAVISGRPTDIAELRHRELGIEHFLSGVRDKFAAVNNLCGDIGVDPRQAAYIGDDLPDLPAFRACGLRIAVHDAAPELKKAAQWVTRAKGGHGAVREVCEAILKARGDWQRWLSRVDPS